MVECQPFFLQGSQGRLFALSYRPLETEARCHGVLFVPPFAEEMNKSRRMLTQQARLLAEDGYLTLLPDLYGSGESEGGFEHASWAGWCDDIVCGYRWLLENGAERVSVVAQRVGALLIAELLRQRAIELDRLVLWQPVVAGELFLNQFLRLRLAAEMTKNGAGKSSVSLIRQELEQQGSVEVAGYTLSRDLAQPLTDSRLELTSECFSGVLHWCELVATPDRPVTAVAQKGVATLQGHGVRVELHKIVGHPFWGATEIEDVPALLKTTCGIFSQ
ncbi:MAG: hydrolase 2, exosortase A system-associated [Pseudomonadota bacterium]|nr:hydrolase 2, exosortase A system-associated [Pseudomonadota bacterium]